MTPITTRRRWALAVGAVAFVLLAAVAYVPARSWLASSPAGWPREAFSRDAWFHTPRAERYRLYRDLDAQRLLTGKTKNQLVELLGEPDYVAHDGRYLDYVLREWKPGSRMLNAVVWLHIQVDGRGMVASYHLRSE